MASTKKWTPPKSLAQCADACYTIKQERLELQKKVDELKDREQQLKDKLTAELPKGEASGIAGKVARVAILMQLHADLKDEKKARDYAVKTGRWDLFYKMRVAERAVKEMWDDGKNVPGVEPIEVPFVSVNKL